MIPGRNNLALAMRLITPQTVELFRFNAHVTTPDGTRVAQFHPPVPVVGGSVQPVTANSYQRLGLDFAKRYVHWWAPVSAVVVRRGQSADEFEWNSRRYRLVNEASWVEQDGWVQVMGVEIA